MDPQEDLLKDEPSASEFENHSDEIIPEEAENISGGGAGPYAEWDGS